MKLTPFRKKTTTVAKAVALALFSMLPSVVLAQVLDKTVDADVTAQPVSTALIALSKQAGVQILMPGNELDKFSTAGLHGRMSLREALSKLLSGTRFGFHQAGDNTIGIDTAPDSTQRATPAAAGAAGVAQEAAAATASAQAAAPPAAKADGATVMGSVTVTGSRIARNDFQSDSPISTIDRAAIEASGQPSLDRVFAYMPQFAGAQGASEVGDAQAAIGFSGGQAYSDLRGIGPNRSLVLLDGRRLMPSAPDGSIDLNTIPMVMIDNVEVITGGASAAYGSDAIAGVVNLKLKQKFSGIELNVKHGSTTKGDGETNQYSALFGGNFADDRGNAMLALEYSDRATVDGSTRPFFSQIRQLARPPEGIIAAGLYGGGAPTIAAVNSVLAGYSGTTPIAGSGLYNGAIGVNTDGTIFTMGAGKNCVQNYKGLGTVKGTNISADCTKVQVALGQYFAVQVPLTKKNVFSRVNYDFSDSVSLYNQFNFTESSAVDQTSPGSSKTALPLIIPQNSPFVTGNAGLQTILSSISPAPTKSIILTKLMVPFGNRVETFKYDVWQELLGLKGDIPGTRLKWDVYGSFGRSQFSNDVHGDISLSAINSILGGTANYKGNAGNCIGYAWNALGNNPISAGCLEYAGRNDHNSNTQTQKLVEATVQGPLFHLLDGETEFALGTDYRQVDFNYKPDSIFVTGDSLAYGSQTSASGQQKVGEVFGEMLLPLLIERPFAKELTFDLGYRYSKYDSFSGKSTWKADMNWSPIEQMHVRGGYSVAVRAPSLLNLYGPRTTSNLPIGTTPHAGDPCDVNSALRTGPNAAKVQALCVAQGVPSSLIPSYSYTIASVDGVDGSNADLLPEKAKTWSLGTVIQPDFDNNLFHNLQFSIDYYNIKISDAIGTLALTDILPRCFNADGVSNPDYSLSNPYCQRITRDPSSGNIIRGQQGLFNFGRYSLDGIDAQVDWRFALEDLGASSSAGNIQIASVVSYLKNYKVAGLFGTPTYNYAGSIGFGLDGGDITHPHWKANTALTYSRDGFSTSFRWRYIGSMIHSDRVQNPTSTAPGVPSYSYFDIDAHYTFAKNYTVSVGVNNLSGKSQPPFVSAAPLTTDAATYDVIGRTWFASVRAKF